MLILGLGVALVAAVVVAILISKLFSYATFLQQELLQPIKVTLEDFESLNPPKVPSILDPPAKSLSIIVPAYNEEERLSATLDEAISFLQRKRNRLGPHFTYEIIVVDDGSKDNTRRVAAEYVKKYGFDAVRVLRVSSNRGKGHAVKRGMQCARGELLLFMDADGATRMSDLDTLEEALSKVTKPSSSSITGSTSAGGSLGAAFGSRAHLEQAAAAKRSRLRNFLTWGFHMLVMLVAGGRIRDTQCGFKLFTRQAAGLVYSNQRLQRWCFDVELLYLADQFGIPVTEVSVNWTEMPGSKIRFTSILHMAFELLVLKVMYQVLGLWRVYSDAELRQLAGGAGGPAASKAGPAGAAAK
mmetsp:Transcript_24160/g.52785  ORF Transcript_24160/g.52785 Transcript_24160/m.52785 type:complete len:356 (+) Transcript_24160:132-1199(+)|eukprot:CAMPEP_0202894840 /NCGR_PEP_ID=MMETSP1392-20130828/4141_1 /ASSEMBLY_ACC=CAM_ASM_000868 /TAXON_ID=225041 /ORGANISM="Chlamydomonas chlamydogama, Strain SAG 11-48b" /LENGTH=355 /DNA_ID=CAMNT_0049579643 /DNA_START=68 /DNA_END=1135 /DNA_ORIENTATION=-